MRESTDLSQTMEETLFAEALALPSAMRREFVERTCEGNRELAGRLIALLDGYQGKSAFLDTPAPAAVLNGSGLDVPTSRPEPMPGDRVGRYRILERIGEGGFGIVYIADQEEPVRRRVALKLIRLGMDTQEFIARFEAERQALALMDHPNIARVVDAGATHTGRPYLVMEWVRGIPITTYCDEHRLSLRNRLELFITVCGAIQHAHQKGVIHRDLKPSNILVAHEADSPVPKVIDFGIAKATSAPLTDKTLFTVHHALIGTPGYTSPEQMEIGPRDVDTRSDVYSLGALLYELLSGCAPFDRAELQRANFDDMRRIVREVEPPRASERVRALMDEERRTVANRRSVEPSKLSTLLASDLDWIAMRCLEKDRSRRYETASALALDIRRHLENEPVLARPPSRGYRLHKFVRRHRIPVYATTAVALSLVCGLIATGILLMRERAAAEKSRQVAQFMKDMLGGVGPSVARGRDTTLLREVLDTTIRRLDTELRDQPEIAADLRHTLGVASQAIGDYEQAAMLWRDTIATRRELGGSDSVELAATLHKLGSLLGVMNEVTEAEALLQEALDIRRRTLGPDHFDVGTTLAALANNIGSHRFAREREALLREALAIQRKYPGLDDDEIAQTLTILGYVLFSTNHHDEASAALRESIEIRRKLHGGPHPHLAESLSTLMQSMEPLRRAPGETSDEERALRREILLVVRKVRGPANAKLVAALLAFTRIRPAEEDLAGDLRLAREVFADLQKTLPDDSPDLAVAQFGLASAIDFEPGHSEEAESLAQDAVTRIRRARENGVSPHPETSRGMQAFIHKLHAEGRLHYALLMAEELKADNRFGAVLSYGPPVDRTLGRIYFDLGRHAEAAPLLEATALRERSPWRPMWRSAQRVNLLIDFAYLGEAYRKLGRVAESRRVLELALARKIESGEEHDPAQRAHAAIQGELGYTAMAEGKFAEAETLFREALKGYETEPGVNQWDLHRPRGRIVSGLGLALAGQGKFVEAERFVVGGFEDLMANQRTFWGDPIRMLREALEAVVQVYRAAGKAAQATEWERKLTEPPFSA